MDTDKHRSKTFFGSVISFKNPGPSESIHVYLWLKIIAFWRLCVFAFILSAPVAAQRVAILAPDTTDQSRDFAWNLEQRLIEKVGVLDSSIGSSVFNSAPPEKPFNLTKEESKRIGAAIGCDYFMLIKSATLRRSASKRPEYYEANAAIYVISSRTGRLVFWKLHRFEANKLKEADKMLVRSIDTLAAQITASLHATTKSELSEPTPPNIEEVPNANSPETKNFRPPIPYRRIKPEYTAEAALYDIKVTVDILVDLDAFGAITRTEIVRWAGYGLDESVEKTVRQMNWRPAERGWKTLPMRFLVRYNFKKVEKE